MSEPVIALCILCVLSAAAWCAAYYAVTAHVERMTSEANRDWRELEDELEREP